jgi:chitinase
MASGPKGGQARIGLTLLSIVSVVALGFFLGRDWSSVPASSVSRRAVDKVPVDEWTTPANLSSLVRREDYTCAKGRPCANGACCGSMGVCGYGPTYCGTGCMSNCNAHAECGQYSEPPGKTCPLNTCCSQYGFCGTTRVSCCSLLPRRFHLQ